MIEIRIDQFTQGKGTNVYWLAKKTGISHKWALRDSNGFFPSEIPQDFVAIAQQILKAASGTSPTKLRQPKPGQRQSNEDSPLLIIPQFL